VPGWASRTEGVVGAGAFAAGGGVCALAVSSAETRVTANSAVLMRPAVMLDPPWGSVYLRGVVYNGWVGFGRTDFSLFGFGLDVSLGFRLDPNQNQRRTG